MITKHIPFRDRPTESHTLFYMFALPGEIEAVIGKAANSYDRLWQEGRQGGGYYKLDIKHGDDTWGINALIKRALAQLAGKALHEIWKNNAYDAWILFYPSGSHVPEHNDPIQPGSIPMHPNKVSTMRHKRLNVVVKAPRAGGELVLRHTMPDDVTYEYVNVQAGDAVMFYPSEVTHEITPCDGNRIVVSVGILEPIECVPEVTSS